MEKGMIELVNRENGGKTAAINTGLVSARREIIVVIDGDGVIKENALEELVKKFQRQVGAVAGNIKVGNRTNIITKDSAPGIPERHQHSKENLQHTQNGQTSTRREIRTAC